MEKPRVKLKIRLAAALNRNNMKPVDLANKTGLTKAAISNYMNGKSEGNTDSIFMMADALNVNPVWLSGYDVPIDGASNAIETELPSDTVPVKVYRRVAAGIPLRANEDDVVGTIMISAKQAESENVFAIVIQGDSMEPELRTGDIVVVRQQKDALSGDTVIARINGLDATCKRLKKYPGGDIDLISENPKYAPMHFTMEDQVRLPVEVIGKVIEARRKF